MSRRELVPIDETVSCVIVGWDRPLCSYFAHVYLTGDDNEYDAPTHAIGDDFFEVTDPGAVVDMVSTYAKVPDDLIDMLKTDEKNEGRADPPALVAMLSAPLFDTSALPCPF
ncbi:hypothetical protein [Actinoplanes sp. NPDC051859]|uniref:hypothetical protein n=1 Tax=Actinoplanes sp. NPDC051859 TaxID=3363909 RepID=UPI00379C99C0